MHIGKYIKHLRTAKEPSWTLEKVSELSGISQGHLSDVERGAANPSLNAIIALAEVYGMGAGDLLVAAGYTTNPRLSWQCDALIRVVCQEGRLTFEPVPNAGSDIS